MRESLHVGVSSFDGIAVGLREYIVDLKHKNSLDVNMPLSLRNVSVVFQFSELGDRSGVCAIFSADFNNANNIVRSGHDVGDSG